MYEKQYLYEFDPSGGLAANKVPGELHTITPAATGDFDFFIPNFAPFFRKGLVVTHVASGQVLTEGVHYDLGMHFAAASLETQVQIFGCIVVTDRTLSGVFKIDYQTLGGEWVLDTQTILTIINNLKTDPRTIKWEDLTELPTVFPVVEHLHHADDLVGMQDVVAALAQIKAVLGDAASKAILMILEHIRDESNPHHTTLNQLGLDEVGDLIEATEPEVDIGTNGTHFITARRLQYFLSRAVTALFTTHTSREDNPHNVTALQLNLDQVPNFKMASIAEAIAGELNTRFMSPSLTKAVVSNAVAAVNQRIDNFTVSKATVGLDQVENYPPATMEQAVAGVSNAVYMTALRTQQAIAVAVLAGINQHLAVDNPHHITATTIGLDKVANYAVATAADILANSGTTYLTPAGATSLVSAYVTAGVANDLAMHQADHNNPHQTNKTHIGLSSVENYPPVNALEDVVVTNNAGYLTPAGFLTALWTRLSEKANSLGKVGDVPFIAPSVASGGVRYERLVKRTVNVASNTSELTTLQSMGEDFKRVYDSWKRISILTAPATPANTADLSSWSYAGNHITSTAATTALAGFVSSSTYDSYTFDVTCSSTASTGGWIGILLGSYTTNGEYHTLTALRSPQATNGWVVAVDYATANVVYLYQGDGGLAAPSQNDWGHNAVGTRIRAVKTTSGITITTSAFNSTTLVSGTAVTVSLTDHAEFAFAPVGYVAQNQLAATWTTTQRPDGPDPIYDLTTGSVLAYDGSVWSAVADPTTLVSPGRLYHTPVTGKTHFVENLGDVFLIADNGEH